MEDESASGDLLETVPEADASNAAHAQASASGQLPGVSLIDRRAVGIDDTSLAGSLYSTITTDFRRQNFATLVQIWAAWATEDKRRYDLQQRKSAEAEAEHARVSLELQNAQKENAELKAENRERAKHQPLVGLAYVLGTLFSSTGAEQISAEHLGLGALLATSGLLLVLAAFMVSRKGDGL